MRPKTKKTIEVQDIDIEDSIFEAVEESVDQDPEGELIKLLPDPYENEIRDFSKVYGPDVFQKIRFLWWICFSDTIFVGTRNGSGRRNAFLFILVTVVRVHRIKDGIFFREKIRWKDIMLILNLLYLRGENFETSIVETLGCYKEKSKEWNRKNRYLYAEWKRKKSKAFAKDVEGSFGKISIASSSSFKRVRPGVRSLKSSHDIYKDCFKNFLVEGKVNDLAKIQQALKNFRREPSSRRIGQIIKRINDVLKNGL